MAFRDRYTGLINRYRDHLPVSDDTRIISLGEGNTPLIRLKNIPKLLGKDVDIYVKYEGLNPTGSSSSQYSSENFFTFAVSVRTLVTCDALPSFTTISCGNKPVVTQKLRSSSSRASCGGCLSSEQVAITTDTPAPGLAMSVM